MSDSKPDPIAVLSVSRHTVASLAVDLAREREQTQLWRQQAEEANTALKAERVLREAAERGRDRQWDDAQKARVALWTAAQTTFAALQAKLDALIPQFVERVNQRAEAEMMRTGVLEGAHQRAIDAELDARLAARPEPVEGRAGGAGSLGAALRCMKKWFWCNWRHDSDKCFPEVWVAE